ncbi:MAG: TSUP family transporter [Proteobacteria bacterium]|nr:TSUP family transporter [Pseudomonadota bacterium]
MLLLAAAFVAGGIDAVVGGGGLIQLPALFAALPEAAPPTLLGTSKLAGFAGTASATLRYARSVVLPWRALAPAAALAALASLAGSVSVMHVSARVFRPLVPLALGLVLGYTLAHRHLGRVHAPRTLDRSAAVRGAGLIALIGFYDGFFGPGTGSFLMLLFIRFHGYDFLNAAAAARLVNLATNLVSLLWFGLHGSVRWPLGLAMALANVGGAQLGTRLALRRGTGFVRTAFVIIVSALIVKTAWDAIALGARR